jgi:hypothetical protein
VTRPARRRIRGRLAQLAIFTGTVALPAHAIAQGGAAPEGRLWPTGQETARSAVGIFGSVVQCTLLTCDRTTSLGVDARLIGPFRIAVSGPAPDLQYGVSYGWRHIDVATRIGRGTSVIRVMRRPTFHLLTHDYRDWLGRSFTDSSLVADSSIGDATRWSSAEARLGWRENRWWVTALAGRVAVAQQGAAVWGGIQIGADIGRGASLLLGAGMASRQLAFGDATPGRNNVSLGLGFNTAVLSSHSEGATPAPTSSSASAFSVSPMGLGRVRVLVRVPSATSVAFASDCTGWRPVEMMRTGNVWVVEIAATAGLHHANIRVDGGPWIVPPGLASLDDDFAGKVGIFVVE